MSSKVDKILQKYGITQDDLVNILTKSHKQKKLLTSWTSNTNVAPHTYHQTDILYLPETTSPKGYKFCLVVVDVETREVRIIPLVRIRADDLVGAFKKVYTGKKKMTKPVYLLMDKGSEFKNSKVQALLKKLKINYRFSETKRHSQQAIVEAMNKTIGTAILKILLNERLSTGEVSTNWLMYVPTIVKTLNENTLKTNFKKIKGDEPILKSKGENILPQGSKVRIRIDDDKFRGGDVRWSVKPHTVEKILLLPNRPVQYMVSDKTNAFVRSQIKLYKLGKKQQIDTDEVYVKDVLDKIKEKNKVKYKVKLSNGKIEWKSRTELKNEGHTIKKLIDEFNKQNK